MSALKDNLGNPYSGGKETKAVLLNAMAAMQGGQVLSEDQLFEMQSEMETTTPYSMANITGGEQGGGAGGCFPVETWVFPFPQAGK